MSSIDGTRRGPEIWTTEAFVEHFMRIDKQMPERPFAFVLGAGASVSSGIPSGGQLVDRWLAEIKLRDTTGKAASIDTWATSETLGIDDFEYGRRAEFYPQIYNARFGTDLDEGYAYLEDVMKDAEPSLGYSMLAQILAETRHKVAITTNFDNLVADSVLIFTNTFAQICGHESLTGYIRVQPRRPLVAKIHRDLLLDPQNDPWETNLLHEDWARELRRLFTHCTPIFVGYGGNDGSLMNFLESMRPGSIPGGIYWAFRDGNQFPNKRILNLVAKQYGKLVSILDFDVFMTQLAEPLGFGLLDARISAIAETRADRLRNEWDKAKRNVSAPMGHEGNRHDGEEAVRQAREVLAKVESRRAENEDHWWSWNLRAGAESDPVRREDIYKEGLERFPFSSELMNNFANFMTDERKDHDEAERLYRKALELEPDDADIIGNLAVLLTEVRKNHDEAERLFRRAQELDPNHIENTTNFISLLIFRDQLVEARNASDHAWQLKEGRESQVIAELILYRSLLSRFEGKADEAGLGRLKCLLEIGFPREYGSPEAVMSAAKGKLDNDELALYKAVSAAIFDQEMFEDLNKFPRWAGLTPIGLDEIWEPLTG